MADYSGPVVLPLPLSLPPALSSRRRRTVSPSYSPPSPGVLYMPASPAPSTFERMRHVQSVGVARCVPRPALCAARPTAAVARTVRAVTVTVRVGLPVALDLSGHASATRCSRPTRVWRWRQRAQQPHCSHRPHERRSGRHSQPGRLEQGRPNSRRTTRERRRKRGERDWRPAD